MNKSALRIAAYVLGPVGPQPLRRIVFWIKAHAQEVCARKECRICRQLLLDRSEVVRHAGAEVRQGAARVNECNKQLLTSELLDMNLLPILIAQCEIRY